MSSEGGRYSRLIQLPWWAPEVVSKATAIVCGCGALGNEVVKNLALVGWGRLVLVDMDALEMSNLTRAVMMRPTDVGKPKATILAEAARQLNEDCLLVPLVGDLRQVLTAGMIRRADVVLGCVDNMEARIALSRLAAEAGTPLIDGGLTSWESTVSVYGGDDVACYACTLYPEDLQELATSHSCPAHAARVRGRGGIPTLPTVASIAGATMAQLALKWVHGFRSEPEFPIGRQLRFEALQDRFWNMKLTRNEACPLHPQRVSLRKEPHVSWDDPWSHVLGECRKAAADEHAVIRLPIALTENGIRGQESAGSVADTALIAAVRQISGEEGWLGMTPRASGLASWSWIEVVGREHGFVMELSGCGEDLVPLECTS